MREGDIVMSKYYVLYHRLDRNDSSRSKADGVSKFLPNDELIFKDVLEINDYQSFFDNLEDEDGIIVTGGDGSLHKFINRTNGINHNHHIYYFPTGTGNDFYKDIGGKKNQGPVVIDQYLRFLPTVTVNGKSYKYINNVSFGIDGYCTAAADDLRAKGKKVNYTTIALDGLLAKYKPCDAIIEIDGVKQHYKKVWLASTMNGRYLGGGMMAAPGQNRLNKAHFQSVLLYYNKGRLHSLLNFPKIFKGKHVGKPSLAQLLPGRSIHVTFSEPRAIQIDGETIRDVTEYTVRV